MAASTTGQARLPSNHSPASQRSASSPAMTRPMPSARRGVGIAIRRIARLDAIGLRFERREEPGQDVDDDAEARGEREHDERDAHGVGLHAEVMTDAAGDAADPSVAAAALEAGSAFARVDLGHARHVPTGPRPPTMGENPENAAGRLRVRCGISPMVSRLRRPIIVRMTTRTANRPPRASAPWRRPRHRRRRERHRRLLQRRPAADPHRLRRPDGVQRARPAPLPGSLAVHPDRHRRPVDRPAPLRRRDRRRSSSPRRLILVGAIVLFNVVGRPRAAHRRRSRSRSSRSSGS